MTYYYPFRAGRNVISASFAGLSVTASYSASQNSLALSSSYAQYAIYAPSGSQGTSYSPGPCRADEIECPNLLQFVSPEYTMVCLQTGSGCTGGQYLVCPDTIPGC